MPIKKPQQHMDTEINPVTLVKIPMWELWHIVASSWQEAHKLQLRALTKTFMSRKKPFYIQRERL